MKSLCVTYFALKEYLWKA